MIGSWASGIDGSIYWEAGFFLTSAFWGIVLAAIYDVVRICRRVVIHRTQVWIIAEDLLFWLLAAGLVFHTAYRMNDGIIRGFALGGLFGGAFLYHMGTRGWLVEGISSLLGRAVQKINKLIENIRKIH